MPENILAIKDKFDVFLFDMYGVIWDGSKPYEDALKLMVDLRKEGKRVIILSNGAEISPQLEKVYEKRGVLKGVHYDKVVSSGELSRDVFLNADESLNVYQFARGNKDLFVGTKYKEVSRFEDADFIYIGTPKIYKDGEWHNVYTIEPFEKELKAFYAKDKVLICTNPDLGAFSGEGTALALRNGAIAKYYEELGGDVEYIGKPYPEVYDFALKDEDVEDDRVLMIGDTLETDILGANSYGIRTALINRGVVVHNMQEEGFSDIREYAEEVGIIPDYFLEKLL